MMLIILLKIIKNFEIIIIITIIIKLFIIDNYVVILLKNNCQNTEQPVPRNTHMRVYAV